MSYLDYDSRAEISELIGKTFSSVTDKKDLLEFKNKSERYVFFHDHDCCETVLIEDVIGDLGDLENTPILSAEVVSGTTKNLEPWEMLRIPRFIDDNETDGAHLWTFYKFATIKGYVTVRWLGTSNGYYSMSVQLGKENNES